MGLCGELHIERGSIVWLIRKWVQSMCFGSIFTCFGGISIESWNLALCLGITSLWSERQALIWSETHQLSGFAHSNTAQQLKAGRTNTTSHGNSSVVEPFWAARINKQSSGFYKKRKLFPGCIFWEEFVLLPPKTLRYICATKTPGKYAQQQGANMMKALSDPACQGISLPCITLTA